VTVYSEKNSLTMWNDNKTLIKTCITLFFREDVWPNHPKKACCPHGLLTLHTQRVRYQKVVNKKTKHKMLSKELNRTVM